ncbi:prephenate dehydratase [Conexibacter sp. SYSU D00693]|uniref:prephenate dehydratase n=1 Tax=Conexibacter sp. SYSU D00693 TaxID=2812560 RepID=UPI00196A83B9|nr:prephenate dehydratase [Conexibacter sp. SYSU D00693]
MSARWGFLGPAGTFSEEALLQVAAATGAEVEPVPLRTEREALAAVDAGTVDGAVVPIENALEGAVTGTLDALALEVRDVVVLREHVLPVTQALVGAPGTALADVRAVVSHPQALAQCRRRLAEVVPGAGEIAATSTAEAVHRAVSEGGGLAAVGTRRAAELYGGEVLAEHVEDDPGNATRFVLVGHAAGAGTPLREPAAGARHRTTIVFWGGGDATPGWLVRCLDEFASRGVSLTKIESRPRKVGLGHYLFVLDALGSTAQPAVAGAVEALHQHCQEVRVLGSYPAA